MKKLLILTRFPLEYEPQRLAEAAKKKGIKSEIVNYQEVEVSKNKVRLPRKLKLNEFSLVIPRSAAHRYKKSFLKEKIAIINKLSSEMNCLNEKTYLRWPKLGKIKQTQILNKNKIPIIPTLEKPVFPAILKAEFGSHSKRVVRVENFNQAKKIMKTYSGKWLYQPLIKTPIYWRVIVLGNKSLGIMERKTNERFLKLGEGRKPSVRKETIESLAIEASQVFQTELAGVDLLANRDKLMIIEVNRSPQFKIFEKLTKMKVAEKIIKYLISN